MIDNENEVIYYDGVHEEKRKKYNEWEKFVEQLLLKSVDKRTPIKATFELTPLCNLKCKMCYIRLEKDQMDKIGTLLTADEWIKIATEAAENGSLSAIITGGEPFLHPEFIKIYKAIISLGYMVELYTNGKCLSDKILNALIENPPFSMSVTLYGASRETYEKVCGDAEAFDSVIENIKKLQSNLRDTYIAIRTVLIKDNENDLGAMREIAASLGVALAVGSGHVKPIRGARRENFEQIRLPYNKNENHKRINPIDKKHMACTAALIKYAITWDGKMIPCILFSTPYVNVIEYGFKESWERLKAIRHTITIPDRCFDCEYRGYCGVCPARVQAESGTFKDDKAYKCFKNLLI